MRTLISLSLAIVALTATKSFGAPPAAAPKAAEDWPRFLGPRGDGISREPLPDRWPARGPKPLWKKPAGLGFASPIAHQGKVYLFSLDPGSDKEGLVAHDADTGAVAWAQAYDVGGSVDYEGTRATPAIDADRIYTHGSRGLLVCRNLADGRELWRLDVPRQTGGSLQQWGQASSPLVAGDLVYVQGGNGGSIAVAANKQTGALAWKSQATGSASYAQPVLVDSKTAGKQLLVFGGKALYGMDPATGKTLWQERWETSYDVNAAAPVTDGEHVFVSSAYGHGCMMLRLASGGATKLWEKKTIQCKFQTPVLDNGLLYAVSDDNRGVIKCIKWPTGELVWEAKEPKLGFGGSFVRAPGEKLLCMSQTGTLTLLRTSPKGVQGIGQSQVFGEDFQQVWSVPLVYRGRVYAKGEKELVCLDLGAR